MLNVYDIITIFCRIDDFCNELDEYSAHQFIGEFSHKRGPEIRLSLSEIMTLLIGFQTLRFRSFKAFYSFSQEHWKVYFPQLVSYQRMVELIKLALGPLTLFTQLNSGHRTGIYYVDSSALPVCLLRRQKRHKKFESIAKFGKTSMGWFFGLKLHLVINDKGQMIAFKITRGNRNDAIEACSMLKVLEGMAFGDKGYLGKKIFEELLAGGLKLITRKRKNMTQDKLSQYEQQLLDQRNLIETVFNHLKHHYQVWHTRHRSVINAMTHLIAALAAYVIEPLKLSAIKLLSNNPIAIQK